jgi:hypothetical protein
MIVPLYSLKTLANIQYRMIDITIEGYQITPPGKGTPLTYCICPVGQAMM